MAVRYKSTRSSDESSKGFGDVLMEGLSPEGGLYVPITLPDYSSDSELDRLQHLMETSGYQGLAFAIIRPFIDSKECPDDDLKSILSKAYATTGDNRFNTSNVVELKTVNTSHPDTFLGLKHENLPETLDFLELFHGPTFAFKDVALQLLGNFFDYFYDSKEDSRPLMVLGATSGDTGGAAMAGVSNCKNVKCVILYPLGGTSTSQECQMIDIAERNNNIKAIALKDSNFDDCQNIVKSMFMEHKHDYRLVAVNSINWSRILAQMIYYWYTALFYRSKEQEQPVIVVPTGNFGNILAGWYAQRMGAPIKHLVIASNSNDILTRTYNSGEYKLAPVVQTHSPSMDIGVSSNFERLLFNLLGDDPSKTREKFSDFQQSSTFQIKTSEGLDSLRLNFSAFSIDDTTTESIMKLYRDTFGYSVCPHTAVAVGAALKYANEHPDNKNPICVAATADAAKFPHAWTSAKIDAKLVLPEALQKAIDSAGDRFVLPAAKEAVNDFVSKFSEM